MTIIIFHLGSQAYVKQCLQQALKYDNEIILLNDNPDHFKEFSNNTNCKIVNYNKYTERATTFKKMYKHYSTNSYQLELICILRWFCVYEYMEKHDIKRAFICDSDVLIYDTITSIDTKYLKDNDYMLCSSSSKNVTGGQSIWNINKLKEFVDFIFEFYTGETLQKMDTWWKTYKEPGGICDMTLLYYFANNSLDFVGLRLSNFPYFNQDLTQIFNNELTFDLHLATYGNHPHPEEYEVNERTKNKNIKFIDNKPYCYNKRLQKDIRFILLHFQGRNKAIMKDYYSKS